LHPVNADLKESRFVVKYKCDWSDVMPTTNTQVEAKRILDKFTKASSGYKVDADAQKRFMTLCELADILDEEFCADGIQINAEPNGKHGVICVDTDEVLFEHGRSHKFFEYVKSADFLSFSKTKSGMLRFSFGVKDLWVRA